MTETVTAELAERAPAIHLPPATGIPKILQGVAFATNRRKFVNRMVPRLGPVFTCDAPVFGRAVMVTDPQLAKQLFAANPPMSATSSPTCRASSAADRFSRSTDPSTGCAASC